MPSTFGAATTDNVNTTGASSMATGSTILVTGWWLPTTLTAGRGLWSVGATAGCKIHTTTSELQLITDNTTDGLTTTSGLGLTVNTWTFLAFLGSFNDTGPASAWRVWKGDQNTAPVEISTVVTTAPVGNFVGSTLWFVGNLGNGSVAFQGDIAGYTYMHGTGTGPTASILAPTTQGAISQVDADLVLRDLVQPLWLGDFAKLETWDSTRPRFFIEMNRSSVMIYGRPVAGTNPTFAASINGVSVSANGNPRPAISRPSWPLRRR